MPKRITLFLAAPDYDLPATAGLIREAAEAYDEIRVRHPLAERFSVQVVRSRSTGVSYELLGADGLHRGIWTDPEEMLRDESLFAADAGAEA